MTVKRVGLMLLGAAAAFLGAWLVLEHLLSIAWPPLWNAWSMIAQMFLVAIGIYLLCVGLRGISAAIGDPRPKMRFGWGRILLGSFAIYMSALDYFQLVDFSRRLKLPTENQTQSHSLGTTDLVISIVSAVLVFSGIWRGVRKKMDQTAAVPNA